MSAPRGAILALLLAATLGCTRTREPAPKPAPADKAANDAGEKQPPGQVAKTKADLATLTKAVQAYALAHEGTYPTDLKELTKADKGPALVAPEALTDPWGRPYVLEADKRQPDTGVPLIYSLGPYPKMKTSHIQNWK